MSDLLDQINKNSGALSAIFSGVVTVATVFYAWLTVKLVHETRQMRKVQTEPRIEVTYRIRDEGINFLDIVIRNIGLGPAYDIKFEVKSETTNSGCAELVEALLSLSSFQNGLSYLGPNQEYFSFWTSLVEGDKTKADSRIVITCAYRSVTGTCYKYECRVDLSELKGTHRLGEPPMQKIAKQIETLANDFHNVTAGINRLKVDIYTDENRDEERLSVEDHIRKCKTAE
jgi:hypothetical protein